MVRPSGTWGTGSTQVRAGRPNRHEPRARARYLAAPATCPDAPRARIRSCRVARRLPLVHAEPGGGGAMRVIGMDIHRVFAEVAALLDGQATRLGRVDMRRDSLEAFARSTLTHDDHVVVEATGNAAAVVEVLAPHVGRVVIANPKRVRLIADAKVKTDKIDAAVLAELYASGFLPEVWIPDGRTEAMRRQVTRRTQLVRQRTRLKNIVQSILHAHLVPPCPHGDLFGKAGRGWLAGQWLPEDERIAVERHVRELDRLGDELSGVERDIARCALEDGAVKRLMTVPGIDMVVAVGLAAAIGDVARFASAEKLVAYLGLNPSVRQSGDGPARHGRIAKQGRGHARGMLVEVAWAAARSPGPFRAFFQRVSARRGQHPTVSHSVQSVRPAGTRAPLPSGPGGRLTAADPILPPCRTAALG